MLYSEAEMKNIVHASLIYTECQFRIARYNSLHF